MREVTQEPPPPVPVPVFLLAMANGALFAIGAMLHVGVAIVDVEEPVLVSAALLEAGGAGMFALATLAMATGAGWARRVCCGANTFAVVAVIAVAMLLGLDGERSSGFVKATQLLRVLFAALSLLWLYQSGRRQASAA